MRILEIYFESARERSFLKAPPPHLIPEGGGI